ncbi:MAG: hypothetical protein ABJH98_03335 [Reichenbachiella sp.]|uniref:hypothetical protein n=1 Tax=Reichenbachiella sp. TaxID=2184521 RepID=UPI003298E28A
MFQLFQTTVIQSAIYFTNGWLVYNMASKYMSDHDQSALFLWVGIPAIGLVNYLLAKIMHLDDPKMGKHFTHSAILILLIWLPLLYFLPSYL